MTIWRSGQPFDLIANWATLFIENGQPCFDIIFVAKRAGGSGQNIIARQWANGKPSGDFIIGNKVMEA